jgi:carbon monoxide dehydrogenase subunit G
MVMVHGPFTMVAVLTATIVFAAAEAPRIAVVETGGAYHVTAEFTVAATPAAVAAVLTDFERIPEFMPDVTSSEVLSRTETGLVVQQEAVAKFMMFSKRMHLVLDVREDGGTIRFRDRCGKSFISYEGAWHLTGTGGDTAVSYKLSAKPAFEVPRFVLTRLLKRDAAAMIERLRMEIAARTASR